MAADVYATIMLFPSALYGSDIEDNPEILTFKMVSHVKAIVIIYILKHLYCCPRFAIEGAGLILRALNVWCWY